MLGETGELLMVDDSDSEVDLARECFRLSRLRRPWRAFTSALDFLDHLEEVETGSAPMPALVLLDINMPHKSGWDVLATARANPFFHELPPFLVFTNSQNPMDRERAVELGADGFHVKPDTVADYVAFFDSLARPSGGGREDRPRA